MLSGARSGLSISTSQKWNCSLSIIFKEIFCGFPSWQLLTSMRATHCAILVSHFPLPGTGTTIFNQFLDLSESILHFYKYTVCSRIEYCCQIWSGVSALCLMFLSKIQRKVCNDIAPDCSDDFSSLVSWLHEFKRSTGLAVMSHNFIVEVASFNQKNVITVTILFSGWDFIKVKCRKSLF